MVFLVGNTLSVNCLGSWGHLMFFARLGLQVLVMTSHWFRVYLQCWIISQSANSYQYCDAMEPLARGNAFSATVDDSDAQFKFGPAQIHTLLSILGM